MVPDCHWTEGDFGAEPIRGSTPCRCNTPRARMGHDESTSAQRIKHDVEKSPPGLHVTEQIVRPRQRAEMSLEAREDAVIRQKAVLG